MENLQTSPEYPIWHPFTPQVGTMAPLPVASGKGARLVLEDGTEIIDAISSWWVSIHGHSHPAFANALFKQANTLEQVIFAGFSHKPAQDLALRLLPLLGDNYSKAFFSDNGSTAIEVALKMAMQYFWNNGLNHKTRFIALTGSYHGDTFGAMSVAEPSAFTAPYKPLLFEVDYLDIPYCTNIHLPLNEDDFACIESFKKLVKEHHAAFIFEPFIQGASGMQMYKVALLDQLIAEAKKACIICIADEVMTGFSRTGKLFAIHHLTNQPDIVCLSKALTGGILPMGLTICTLAIWEAYNTSDLYKTFFHGHSFTANPLACTCANTSLDLLLSADYCHYLSALEASNLAFKAKVEAKKFPIITRACGPILAFELLQGSPTSYVHEARHILYAEFLKRNVLLRPLGNVVYILPPYVISKTDLDLVYTAIEEVFELLFNPSI
jgi:adenosylmethionine-8-amino-7-oxononanoate aminotransferase